MMKPSSYFHEERGYDCEWCGLNRSTERHHALYRRMKKHKRDLDVEENILMVCKPCHDNQILHPDYGYMLNSHNGKRVAYYILCDRYGEDHMIRWNSELPLLVKENFE